MHPENNSHGSYGYRAGRCQSGHQHNDRRSRDSGTSFRCDEQNSQQTELLPQRKFKTDRLSKKERGGCKIETSAVMIKGRSAVPALPPIPRSRER